MEVLCEARRPAPSGQHKVVSTGKAQTRWLQGTGIRIIRETHFNPKHLTTCFRDDLHGIAVATLGRDPAAGAALDGVVGGQDDGPVAGEDGDDQAEQDLPGGQAGPRHRG